jgi:hypothetical protein
VPIFLERFLLYLCAGAFLGFVINNGMGLDVHQRIGLGVALVGAAYFLGHTAYKAKQLPPTPAKSEPATEPPATPASHEARLKTGPAPPQQVPKSSGSKKADERPSDAATTKKEENMPDEPKVSQRMTNSPGGIQVGRDMTVNVNPSRRLSEAQKQLLIGEMSKSIGANGANLITCILRAGWNLPGSGFSQAIYSGLPRGVIVKIHSQQEAELPQIARLVEALYRLGLERSGEIDPNVGSGEFRIIIGARP